MKFHFLIVFILLLFSTQSIKSQIQITSLNKKLLFNTYTFSNQDSVSIDLDSDLHPDYIIGSEDLPVVFSQIWYCKSAETSNTQVKYEFTSLLKVGQPLQTAQYYTWPIPFCETYSDSDQWPMSISNRFLGFRKITNTDTNYGWVQLQFHSNNISIPNFDYDTLLIAQLAYNHLSNDTLQTGQTTSTNTHTQTNNALSYNIQFSQNEISVYSTLLEKIYISIYSSYGNIVTHLSLNPSHEKHTIPIDHLAKGIYILQIVTERSHHATLKFTK